MVRPSLPALLLRRAKGRRRLEAPWRRSRTTLSAGAPLPVRSLAARTPRSPRQRRSRRAPLDRAYQDHPPSLPVHCQPRRLGCRWVCRSKKAPPLLSQTEGSPAHFRPLPPTAQPGSYDPAADHRGTARSTVLPLGTASGSQTIPIPSARSSRRAPSRVGPTARSQRMPPRTPGSPIGCLLRTISSRRGSQGDAMRLGPQPSGSPRTPLPRVHPNLDRLDATAGCKAQQARRAPRRPCTAPIQTKQATQQSGGSSHRFLDPVPLSLLSQHHTTALPSPKRYGNRYEREDPGRTSENSYSTHFGE